MRLYLLTIATIFQRKSWVICLLALIALPFALPMVSSATEKPILVQPARIQAAWGTLWVCSLVWGVFTASEGGHDNVKSGIGEYFRTCGITPTKQLLAIWSALITFIFPFSLVTLLICHFGALPSSASEHRSWLLLNTQYTVLFLLVISPLLLIATAIASRFGSITGFATSLLLAIYGLYGVSYLDNLLKLEANPLLRSLWIYSPHYRYADLTQRLYFKSGPLTHNSFLLLALYFLGIAAVYSVIARICFRTSA